MSGYHLDRELTKQELQMENRSLRNELRHLGDMFTELDLRYGADGPTHRLADKMLVEIKRSFERVNAVNPDAAKRAMNTIFPSTKDTP